MTDTLNPLATTAVLESLVAERDALKAYIRELEDEPIPEIVDMRIGVKSALEGAAWPETAQHQPNNDEVICPNCTHQFRAIPVNVQRLMIDSGIEPPFLPKGPK